MPGGDSDEVVTLAFLVIANAAMDLAEHLDRHNASACVIADALTIADTATEAANGQLTDLHISVFRRFLESDG